MKRLGVILFGIVFIGVGIFSLFHGNELKKRCTKIVDAKVVRVEEEYEDDANGNRITTYYPIIEYDADGQIISTRYENGSSTNKYSISSKLVVLYNPDKPSEFIVKGDNSSNVIGIAFPILGFAIVLMGIFKKNIE